MRLEIAVAVLAAAAATPETGYFRYERPLLNAPAQEGQTCVVLDSGIFAHAAPQLADLRLYRDGAETPYAVYVAAPSPGGENSIAPLNLGLRGGQTVFDAAMPEATYSDVQLNVAAHDFIASVAVSGSQAESPGGETKIGNYTIFDLTQQKLGRSTVLHLPESDFRFLHFRIAGLVKPAAVGGLWVERLTASRPKYVTVAETATAKQDGRSTVVELQVPENVPVDRVVFDAGPQPENFSRDVSIEETATAGDPADREEVPSAVAVGDLLRVHAVERGHRIAEERLALEAPAGANFKVPVKWKIRIDNGDDPPIEFKSVRLEMLERSLCFNAAAGAGYTLYYGDAALASPRYDYARLFAHEKGASQATAAPEQRNATFHPRPDSRPFTTRHPTLLWIALVAVVLLLGLIALRSTKSAAETGSVRNLPGGRLGR